MKKLFPILGLLLLLSGCTSEPKEDVQPILETPDTANQLETQVIKEKTVEKDKNITKVYLNAENTPPKIDPLVQNALCNSVEFNISKTSQTIPFYSPETGITFELPYNADWGNYSFKINPYNEYFDGTIQAESGNTPTANSLERIEFGPVLNIGECQWIRPYYLSFQPAKSAEEVINLIKNDDQQIIEMSPTIIKINDLEVVKYATRSVYLNPTLEVMGNKFNYRFSIQSENMEQDFKILEDMVKTVKLINNLT